jgi:hypothetical protein
MPLTARPVRNALVERYLSRLVCEKNQVGALDGLPIVFSFVRFEVAAAMAMKYVILWNGTRKFSLNMEAESHSETVQFYQEQAITFFLSPVFQLRQFQIFINFHLISQVLGK